MHFLSLARPPLALFSLMALSSISLLASAAPSLGSQAPVPQESAALLSIPMPECTSSACWDDKPLTSQAVGLRVVYLNFEGVTLTSNNQVQDDATLNRTWIIQDVVSQGNTLTIAPFNPNSLGQLNRATSRQQIIDHTISELVDYHLPYNFEFTLTRPSSGAYHMVVFGGTCESVIGQPCAGIAPGDCGDMVPSNIVFVFPQGLRTLDLAPTAAQELAHALGLSHTQDNTDIMFPFIQQSIPDGYGAGAIPAMDQAQACGGASFQDSHERMLGVTGFPGQDGTPPIVRISSPINGQVVSPGTPVVATIEDASPIVKVVLSINNAAVETKTSPPFTFSIPGDAADGTTVINLRATDDQGNEAGAVVNVVIGDGSEEACDNGACPDGFSCSNGLCSPDTNVEGGALGDSCTGNESCASNTCATVADEKRCSQSCDAENTCPDGFECLSDTACWPKASDGGCSIGGSKRGMLSGFGLLCFAMLFSAGRSGQRSARQRSGQRSARRRSARQSRA